MSKNYIFAVCPNYLVCPKLIDISTKPDFVFYVMGHTGFVQSVMHTSKHAALKFKGNTLKTSDLNGEQRA